MRITRPFVLLALAALLAPRVEASRTSVWESNPPAAVLAKTDAAGLLAALAPARPTESIVADVEPVEPLRFDLGDVVLVESALEHEDRFDLGPLELLGPAPLRGPPPSYPETRVRGFELLPPFRVGAPPRLSLWPRQACGFACREVASDSRYDPWGLCLGVTDGPCSAVADSIKGAFEKAKGAVRSGLGSGAGSVAIDAVVSTGLDVVDAFLVDPLRAGEATGDAIGSGAGVLETGAAVLQDAGRAASIAAGAGSLAKGVGKGVAAARRATALGDDLGEAFAAGLSDVGASERALAGARASGVRASGLKGTISEVRAAQKAEALGETVIQSQYTQGAASRGFDFLSFTGEGSEARLFINEVKDYAGRVPRNDFTAFGLGSPRTARSSLSKAMSAAERGIRDARLDPLTRNTLMEQLTSGGARVRVIGGRTTVFRPADLEAIGQRTGFLTGEGFRLP